MGTVRSGHPWHRRGQGWICDHRVPCRSEAESTMGSKSAGIHGQGRMRMKTCSFLFRLISRCLASKGL